MNVLSALKEAYQDFTRLGDPKALVGPLPELAYVIGTTWVWIWESFTQQY